MTLTAVLDANILYSIATADPLVYAAEYGACTLVWSERIAVEYTRSLVREGFPPAAVARRRAAMEQALPAACLPDAAVTPHLPTAAVIIRRARHHDADDAHVIAAALASQAAVIVTRNRRDFPASFAHDGVQTEVLDPDAFLSLLLDQRPDAVVHGMHRYHDDLTRQPRTYPEMLAIMRERGGYRTAADRLARLLDPPPTGQAPRRPA